MNTKKYQCNIIVPGPLGLFVTLKLTTEVSHMSNLHQIQNMLIFGHQSLAVVLSKLVQDSSLFLSSIYSVW